MSAAAIFEIETPYTQDELCGVTYQQTADVMIFAHLNHPHQRLVRYGHANWIMGDAPVGTQTPAPEDVAVVATDPQSAADEFVELPYSYGVTAINDYTGEESPISDVVTALNDLGLKGDFNTISWTAISAASRYRVYAERSGSFGFLAEVEGDTFKDDNVAADYSDSPPTGRDPFDTSLRYPGAVAFHEGRLFLGRTLERPNLIEGSKTDNIYNFDRSSPMRPDDSMTFGLRGEQVNAIRHLLSFKGALLALTSNSIFAVVGEKSGLTPTNASAQIQAQQGVGSARPVVVIDVVLYATALGERVRSLGYSYEADGFRGNDLTVFAPHLFQGHQIVEFAWAEHPYGIVFGLRADGKLLALTWQAEQDVWGWSLCETDGLIESICVVQEVGYSALYAVVRRDVLGFEVRYIERLAYPNWIEETWEETGEDIIVDCACRREVENSSAVYVPALAGLDVAWTVKVGDTLQAKTGTVAESGVLDLGETYDEAVVIVGIPFVSYGTTLPVIRQTGSGSTKGMRQSAKHAVITLMNTRGMSLASGGIENEFDDAQIPESEDDENYPPAPFTGDIEHILPARPDWRTNNLTFRQDYPLPMVVLGVQARIEVAG